MITIGDRQFNVPPPGGLRSFALQQSLIPVAGRVANVVAQLAGVSSITEVKESMLGLLPDAIAPIGEIFSKMPPGELEKVTRTLLGDPKTGAPESETAYVMISGAKVPLFGVNGDAFETVMKGRTMETWALLWHALEVWYPDFFDRARRLFAQGKAASPSGESTTSTEKTPGPASA